MSTITRERPKLQKQRASERGESPVETPAKAKPVKTPRLQTGRAQTERTQTKRTQTQRAELPQQTPQESIQKRKPITTPSTSPKRAFHVETAHLITEDDEPVDNVFSAKQQRLLVETLYTNTVLWNPDGRTFIADANVGIFSSAVKPLPALVPDAFVSMDVDIEDDFDFNENRAYFAWLFGKMPDAVIEIISNRKGGELAKKVVEYARLHIPYYAVFDPFDIWRGERLRLFVLQGSEYVPAPNLHLKDVGLNLCLWNGRYEDMEAQWLRWCTADGTLIPTGKERVLQEQQLVETEKQRAETEKQRAETEKQRAEVEQQRAEAEKSRADRLAEKLRALGINPDE